MDRKQKPTICCVHGLPCKKGREPTTRPIDAFASMVENDGYVALPLQPAVYLSMKPTEKRRGPERNSLISSNKNFYANQFPNSRQLSIVPQNETYENLTDINNAISNTLTMEQPIIPSKSAKALDDVAAFYLGVMSENEAACLCPIRTKFRLYHKLEPINSVDSLVPNVQLFLVYRTSTGSFRHFPIIEEVTLDPFQGHMTYYAVGDTENAQKFITLVALVRYYNTYVQMQTNSKGVIGPDVWI
ncbi:hypothetical protein M3Y94_01227000 [Aphelenchoides besseyi]|nr:hypothetical protein M3Y94_01227000 [Aphelenchoides besseyi]KAI6219665.1 hypothetical protein M3Y95_01090900 [Aphelenchoides besseyi]